MALCQGNIDCTVRSWKECGRASKIWVWREDQEQLRKGMIFQEGEEAERDPLERSSHIRLSNIVLRHDRLPKRR